MKSVWSAYYVFCYISPIQNFFKMILNTFYITEYYNNFLRKKTLSKITTLSNIFLKNHIGDVANYVPIFWHTILYLRKNWNPNHQYLLWEFNKKYFPEFFKPEFYQNFLDTLQIFDCTLYHIVPIPIFFRKSLLLQSSILIQLYISQLTGL